VTKRLGDLGRKGDRESWRLSEPLRSLRLLSWPQTT